MTHCPRCGHPLERDHCLACNWPKTIQNVPHLWHQPMLPWPVSPQPLAPFNALHSVNCDCLPCRRSRKQLEKI